MTEPRDEPAVEILDVGRRRRRERVELDQPLPPMHIGGPQPDDEAATTSSWGRWTALGAALAVGLVCGILVANSRNDAAESAAAAEEVQLVANIPLLTEVGDDALSMTMQFNNTGPLDLEILTVRPEGWDFHNDAPERRPRTARTGEWTTVTSVVVPDCNPSVLPNSLEVAVLTAAGKQTVSVPLQATGVLRDARSLVCSDARPIALGISQVEVLEVDEGGLRMALRMQAFGSSATAAPFDVTGVNAVVGGFAVADAAVPVSFGSGGSSPVEVIWEVVRCDIRDTLGNVEIQVDVTDEDGRTFVEGVPLPGEGIAALARFGEAECGS
ncbi:MAG: hypothetical protein ACRDWI_13230 [Jiangellaceae bacterium]